MEEKKQPLNDEIGTKRVTGNGEEEPNWMREIPVDAQNCV